MTASARLAAWLESDRFVEPDRPCARPDQEITLRRQAKPLRTIELQSNEPRINAGRDTEIILQRILPAVVDEVDSGINVWIPHLLVACYVPAPFCGVAADEIIGLSVNSPTPTGCELALAPTSFILRTEAESSRGRAGSGERRRWRDFLGARGIVIPSGRASGRRSASVAPAEVRNAV